MSTAPRTSTRVSQRAVWLGLLVAALLVAGVASYYASSHPDGLEHVAERTGFIDAAEDSAAADSPLADYQTSGVDDPRVSGGLAGVIGVVVMLVLSTGLFRVVRRRGSQDDDVQRTDRSDDARLPGA